MVSTRKRLLRGTLLLSFAAGAVSAFAADGPRQLKWADLVPKSMPANTMMK
jgi:hypothetical protein